MKDEKKTQSIFNVFAIIILIVIIFLYFNPTAENKIRALLLFPKVWHEIEDKNSDLLRFLIEGDELPSNFRWYGIINLQRQVIPMQENNNLIEIAEIRFSGYFYESEAVFGNVIKQFQDEVSAARVFDEKNIMFHDYTPQNIYELDLIKDHNPSFSECGLYESKKTACKTLVLINNKVMAFYLELDIHLSEAELENLYNSLLHKFYLKLNN